MKNAIIIGALSVALMGTGYWGYTKNRDLQEMHNQAENSYQRAFNELTYDVDLLHDKIGATLAMNSKASLSPALADVWRLSIESKSDIAQLPLKFLPFDKTQAFLTKIGNFSYRTAVRDLEKEPLTDEEYDTLKAIYKKSESVQNGLRNVQSDIIDKNLSWIDVQTVSAQKEAPRDNVIINGFKHVEQTKSTVDQDFGPTFTTGPEQSKELKKLEGEKISESEAKKIAKSYFPIKNYKDIAVNKSLDGSSEPFYSVSMEHKNPKADSYMGITETGGHPLFFITNRDIKKQQISLEDAGKSGANYLKKQKYSDMEIYDSSQYDKIGVFQFVKTVNDVRIYPESIQLKVALDNGKVIGFNAKSYVVSNHKRNIPTPKLTKAQARKKVNPNVKVQEERLAILLNDLNKEVLCYEFIGTLYDDTYDIYVNALTGDEEKVKKL